MAFPKLPDFNFQGSNPLADAVQEFQGKLSSSGILDRTVGDIASTMGEEFAQRSGLSFNPLGVLQGGNPGPATLEFPAGIDRYGNYMAIDIFEELIFEAGVGVKDRSIDNKKSTVKLPLPSQLATGYAQGYKQEGIGVLGASASKEIANTIKNAVDGGETNLTGLVDAATRVKDNVGMEGVASGVASAAPELASAAGGVVAGIPGAVAGDALAKTVTGSMAAAGIARNPHMAVLYEAPNFRTFNFSWDLRPKDAQEAENLRKIIRTLKFHSHPDKTDKEHFFKYPEQFGIRFKRDEFLFKTRRCVLTAVAVDYHGEGTPLYYDHLGFEKAPAVIKLDLSFTETKILTKNEISEGM